MITSEKLITFFKREISDTNMLKLNKYYKCLVISWFVSIMSIFILFEFSGLTDYVSKTTTSITVLALLSIQIILSFSFFLLYLIRLHYYNSAKKIEKKSQKLTVDFSIEESRLNKRKKHYLKKFLRKYRVLSSEQLEEFIKQITKNAESRKYKSVINVAFIGSIAMFAGYKIFDFLYTLYTGIYGQICGKEFSKDILTSICLSSEKFEFVPSICRASVDKESIISICADSLEHISYAFILHDTEAYTLFKILLVIFIAVVAIHGMLAFMYRDIVRENLLNFEHNRLRQLVRYLDEIKAELKHKKQS